MHLEEVTCSNSDFKSILKSPFFVDKTMLIKHIIESDRYVVVTTPPQCGKSTIIDMIKTFLEVEVDEYGDPKTNMNLSSNAINDTANFLVFVNNRLEISKESKVMFQFGRTPVIRVDFKRELSKVNTFYDAIKTCKEVIHRSFKEHEYLLYSEEISLENKQLIRTWCDEHSYKSKIDNIFMSHALLSLSQFLFKHFGKRKVFVLVDNHDFLISKACVDVEKDSEFSEIVNFVYAIIGDLLNENSNSISGAVITGVSTLPGKSGLNLTSFLMCSFSEDHQFREFFGLKIEEVDEIINRCEHSLDRSEIKLLYTNSNGYHSRGGVELYYMYSVFMFIKQKTTENNGKICNYPSQVLEILKKPSMKNIINRLLLGESIMLKAFKHVYPNDVDIRYYLRDSNVSDDILLLYLMNWGLISFSGDSNETSCHVKVPNSGVKEILLEI